MANGVLIDARTFLGNVWKLTAPYWRSEEKWRAWALLASIVALSLGTVYMLVVFNDWNRMFFNAIQEKNEQDFTALLIYFSFLAAVYIALYVYRNYLQQMLQMRWRIWLTRQYLDDWLGEQVYYRLELEHRGTDNPDQRIQDDLRLFTDGMLTYALGLLRETVTVASFIVILWNVSSTLPLTIGGVDHSVPGYLVWAALAYAVVGSALTFYVGRPLIRLNFQQEQREADFRYALVRLRENAEGVALYRGEAAERRGFMSRVERIRENWWGLMDYTKRLNTLTIGYNQIAIVFPYFMAGHRYFTGALTLGNLTQIADAFGQVQTSLSWFVNNYAGLANWKASVDRLLTFHRALEETRAEQARHDGLDVQRDGERTVRAEHLDLVLPNGRTILADTAFTIEPGERVVLTGPSGAGKSTLFARSRGSGRSAAAASASPATRARCSCRRSRTSRSARSATRSPTRARPRTSATTRSGRRSRRSACRNSPATWGTCRTGASSSPAASSSGWRSRARCCTGPTGCSWTKRRRPSTRRAKRLYELVTQHLPGATLVSIAHRPAVAAYHRKRFSLVPDGKRMRLAVAAA